MPILRCNIGQILLFENCSKLFLRFEIVILLRCKIDWFLFLRFEKRQISFLRFEKTIIWFLRLEIDSLFDTGRLHAIYDIYTPLGDDLNVHTLYRFNTYLVVARPFSKCIPMIREISAPEYHTDTVTCYQEIPQSVTYTVTVTI